MWNNRPVQKNVVVLSAEYIEDMYLSKNNFDYENLIKENLAQQITHEIIKHDLMQTQTQTEQFDMKKIHRATIKISPPDITTVTQMQSVYEVQGIKVSNKQLDEAVYNTFPELFL